MSSINSYTPLYATAAGSNIGVKLDILSMKIINLDDTAVIYSDGNAKTTGAAASTFYTITLNKDGVYSFVLQLVALAADGSGDTGTYKGSVKVKKFGGVVTLGSMFDSWNNSDTGLVGASIGFSISGNNLLVVVNGVPGKSLSWKGLIEQIYLNV